MSEQRLTFDLIAEAAERLNGLAVKTPLLASPVLDARVAGRVFLKAENLQRIGAFKFRGAYTALSRLTPHQRARGVVAWSSGNHAQGVAAAAQVFGVPATIVMPSDAPEPKRSRTLSLGAEVVGYDRFTESREDIALGLAEERNLCPIPPYDHVDIMSGQGTVGLEIIEQLGAHAVEPDQVVVPCGGGGLTAGIATVVNRMTPQARVLIAEPEKFDDTCRSLQAGKRVANEGAHRSICDALLAPTPGELTFEVNRRLIDGGVAVSDADVMEAMRFAFDEFRVVVEPGGAVALASVLNGAIPCRDQTTVVILSGGNVDANLFADVVRGGPQANIASTAS